ncbi:hypothetical protein A0H81_12174 [Grifola frondosa]|uniref:Uncharacterized protein n=1 Tax=Grifola frondosa TaxID=5627 RepID=A0A1C7LXZ4_GRIFR|nr:hypothetical protein A0H81_12174 [Grifola frondosa]
MFVGTSVENGSFEVLLTEELQDASERASYSPLQSTHSSELGILHISSPDSSSLCRRRPKQIYVAMTFGDSLPSLVLYGCMIHGIYLEGVTRYKPSPSF